MNINEMREKTMFRAIIVALVCAGILAFFAIAAEAQTNQVRCINLLDGKTVQIFMTMQCPRGWAPV